MSPQQRPVLWNLIMRIRYERLVLIFSYSQTIQMHRKPWPFSFTNSYQCFKLYLPYHSKTYFSQVLWTTITTLCFLAVALIYCRGIPNSSATKSKVSIEQYSTLDQRIYYYKQQGRRDAFFINHNIQCSVWILGLTWYELLWQFYLRLGFYNFG
jgi:hypothetical protein